MRGFSGWVVLRLRSLRGERGSVLPFVAVALLAIIGMAAFAIDLSVGWQNERRAQTAADSAALAGAYWLPADPAAAQTAAQNWVNTNLPGATATVTTPYNGNASEIKVVVNTSSPSFFATIFGVNSLKESATAAAQVHTYKPAAIFAADTNCTDQGVSVGNQNITVTGGIRSDGALSMAGGNHGSFDATTYGGPNHCAAHFTGSYSFPAGYPLADPTDYTWPRDYTKSPPTCTYSGTTFNLSGSIRPGTYCATGSITVSGNGTSGNVTLVASTITISGNGVNLTPYSGKLLLYQTGTSELDITGNNGSGGWIFAPNATVSVGGNNWTGTGFIEAQDVILNGNNWSFTGNGPDMLLSTSLIL